MIIGDGSHQEGVAILGIDLNRCRVVLECFLIPLEQIRRMTKIVVENWIIRINFNCKRKEIVGRLFVSCSS